MEKEQPVNGDKSDKYPLAGTDFAGLSSARPV